MSRLMLFFATGALLATIGCGSGSDIVAVQGVLTHNGKPAVGAELMFMPTSGRPAIGVTDAAGSFKLTTEKTNDGALPGTYKVTVGEHHGVDNPPPGPTSDGRLPPSKFPGLYADLTKTPFTAEVKKGQKNEFTFEMTDK